jgi:geranylgeranyl diphosphate synthase, type II
LVISQAMPLTPQLTSQLAEVDLSVRAQPPAGRRRRVESESVGGKPNSMPSADAESMLADLRVRVEKALRFELLIECGGRTPEGLRVATQHAVLGGGNRLRPLLLLAIASAPGPEESSRRLTRRTFRANEALIDSAASALEFVHCASLVHDDMPCFDNADTRRGQPTVHRMYGEAMALLVGDGLIFASFRAVSRHLRATTSTSRGERAATSALVAELVDVLTTAGGARRGLVAGQAWELEEVSPEIETYHAQKTGALFEAACVMGAILSGKPTEAYAALGAHIGQIYQLLDDWLDCFGLDIGKPTQQDARNGKPNAIATLGKDAARKKINAEIAACVEAVPESEFLLKALVQYALGKAYQEYVA